MFSFNTSVSFAVNFELWPRNDEKLLYLLVHDIFRYVEPFSENHRSMTYRQTDRQTDAQNYDSNSVRATTRAKSDENVRRHTGV